MVMKIAPVRMTAEIDACRTTRRELLIAFGLGAAKLIQVGHVVAVLWLTLAGLAALARLGRHEQARQGVRHARREGRRPGRFGPARVRRSGKGRLAPRLKTRRSY